MMVLLKDVFLKLLIQDLVMNNTPWQVLLALTRKCFMLL